MSTSLINITFLIKKDVKILGVFSAEWKKTTMHGHVWKVKGAITKHGSEGESVCIRLKFSTGSVGLVLIKQCQSMVDN